MSGGTHDALIDRVCVCVISSLPVFHRWFRSVLAYHPDKNIGNKQLSILMFQTLQAKKKWFLSDNKV